MSLINAVSRRPRRHPLAAGGAGRLRHATALRRVQCPHTGEVFVLPVIITSTGPFQPLVDYCAAPVEELGVLWLATTVHLDVPHPDARAAIGWLRHGSLRLAGAAVLPDRPSHPVGRRHR